MGDFKGNVSVDRDGLHGFMTEVGCIQAQLDGDLDALHFVVNDLSEEVERHEQRDWIIGHLINAALDQIEKLAEAEGTFHRKVIDLEKAQGCPPVV